jgi:hypothetical protein
MLVVPDSSGLDRMNPELRTGPGPDESGNTNEAKKIADVFKPRIGDNSWQRIAF